MATFGLALRGYPVGIKNREYVIAILASGDVDASVAIIMTKPDGSTYSDSVYTFAKSYDGWDLKPYTFAKDVMNLAGTYTIYAQATVEGTTYRSNTLTVVVKDVVDTVTYTLRNPDGTPVKKLKGTIALVHKKSQFFGLFTSDDNGKVVVPKFAVDKDWMMEVRWEHPTDPKMFDLVLYDPLDWTIVPTDLKATGWFDHKYFKIECIIPRAKFVDILTWKNPILGRYAEPVGSFVDTKPRLCAYIVANEVLGALPFLTMCGATYDSTTGKLTVVFKGAGIAPIVAIAIIVAIAAIGAAVTSYFIMKAEEAKAEQAKARVEGEKQYYDFAKSVKEDLAAGRITDEEASLLLGSALEYSEKWKPAIVIPDWVWALIAIIVIIVIAYIGYQIVKPKR
jgi:hypothetical protein